MENGGREGVIIVKKGQPFEDEIKITEGMRFDIGSHLTVFYYRCQVAKGSSSRNRSSSTRTISLLQPSLVRVRRPLLRFTGDVGVHTEQAVLSIYSDSVSPRSSPKTSPIK